MGRGELSLSYMPPTTSLLRPPTRTARRAGHLTTPRHCTAKHRAPPCSRESSRCFHWTCVTCPLLESLSQQPCFGSARMDLEMELLWPGRVASPPSFSPHFGYKKWHLDQS